MQPIKGLGTIKCVRGEFEGIHVKESECATNYFSRVIVVVTQMKNKGENI